LERVEASRSMLGHATRTNLKIDDQYRDLEISMKYHFVDFRFFSVTRTNTHTHTHTRARARARAHTQSGYPLTEFITLFLYLASRRYCVA